MIPRLFDGTKTGVERAGNGYGFFNTCSQCNVAEEKNGEYYLEMIISINDNLAKKIAPNMWILAKANNEDPAQFFEIYSVERSNNILTVTANHIKYLYYQNGFGNKNGEDIKKGYIYGNTTLSGTPSQIMEKIISEYLFFTPPFKFSSDIKSSNSINLKDFFSDNLGNFMSNADGGMLNVFGGEYHYNNFSIELLKARGSTTNKFIRYGYNLGDFSQSISNADCYTHVVAFAEVKKMKMSTGVTTEDNPVEIHGFPVQCVEKYSCFEKIKFIDANEFIKNYWDSSKFDYSEATIGALGENYETLVDYLTQAAENYVDSNPQNGLATVSFDISNEQELQSIQNLKLCDKVKVVFGDGTFVESQITEVTYNSLTEKYNKMHVGEKTLSLADFILKRRR